MRHLLSCVSLALIGTAFVHMAVAEETFRCGSKLIETGMTMQDVLNYCGQPASQTVETQDVRSGNQVVGKTELHRWTYESYSATRVLVFDQDRLMSIE